MNIFQLFRNPELVTSLRSRIATTATQKDKYILMEVCGTHTMSVFKYGIRSLLPTNVSLLSGPGCPVCVTSIRYIDEAIKLADNPDIIITTFGDMLRVPGSHTSLEKARSLGADIRILYSPMDALRIAREEISKDVVFLGVGFETTVPTVAASILKAKEKNITNYYVLSAHKIMPPAMKALAESGDLNLNGFIAPPHVSAITGTKIYNFLAEKYKKPCVVTGFEPTDILQGILMLIEQINEDRSNVENQYKRVVTENGNKKAQDVISSVFMETDSEWRGIGVIPGSGLKIRTEFESFDAYSQFDTDCPSPEENSGCICGDVITGRKTPIDCKLFRTVCNPEQPQGACMVSSEGTCSAYFKYHY